MTPVQRELARHALGLPNKRRCSYRNHFVTGEGCADHEQWLEMVSGGFARRRERPAFMGGTDLFRLTKTGATEALVAGECLDPDDFKEGRS